MKEKILVIRGAEIDQFPIDSGKCTIIDSVDDYLIDPNLIPQEKFDSVLIDVHSLPLKDDGKLFVVLIDQKDQDGDLTEALQQLALIQQRTGATNFYFHSCFAGILVNALASMSPEELRKIGLKEGTRIVTFGSSNNQSISIKSKTINEEIVRSGGVDEKLAMKLSLDLAITVKSCVIQSGRVEVGNKHNLHKYPQLFRRIKDPQNPQVKEEWNELARRRFELLKKEKSQELDEEEKQEIKRLNDLFRLLVLYKDLHPEQIPESFVNKAFFESAYRGKTDRVKTWLSYGANVNYSDEFDGSLALTIALQSGKEDLAIELIKAGADVNHVSLSGYTPLMIAAKYNCVRAIELMSNLVVDVDATYKKDGSTALLLAAQRGFDKAVLALLDMGADINKAIPEGSDISGNTALIFASAFGHEKVVQLLIDNGADIFKTNRDGLSAIDFAAQEGKEGVVKILLGSGANFNFSKILAIANRDGHKEVIDLVFPIIFLQRKINEIPELNGKVSVRAYMDDDGFLKPLLICDSPVDTMRILSDLSGNKLDIKLAITNDEKEPDKHRTSGIISNALKINRDFFEVVSSIEKPQKEVSAVKASSVTGKKMEDSYDPNVNMI